jgi:hypothetical protein
MNDKSQTKSILTTRKAANPRFLTFIDKLDATI